MKIKTKWLSLILILCLVVIVNGCCPKPKLVEVIKIEKVYVYEKCLKPTDPNFKSLDESAHLGSAYNVNILLDNLTLMWDYNKALSNTIVCYESQVKDVESK